MLKLTVFYGSCFSYLTAEFTKSTTFIAQDVYTCQMLKAMNMKGMNDYKYTSLKILHNKKNYETK